MKTISTPLIPSWVHSLADYRHMFALSDEDLTRTILDYPACISSFNAEMHGLGHNNVISADQQYQLSPSEIGRSVDNIIHQLSGQLQRYGNRIHFSKENSLEEILSAWQHQTQLFLADYPLGKRDGRYQAAALPQLPFNHFQFELALCADLLFRDKSTPPEQTIMELCRVAKEVRIFPLLNAEGEVFNEIGPTMLTLQNNDYGVEVKEVSYKLQEGSNAMLRVWAKKCVVPE